MARLRLTSLALAFASIAACKSEPEPAEDKGDTVGPEEPASETTDEPVPAETTTSLDSLVAWLDPAAVAAAFVRDDHDLDASIVGAVFGLPPQATELLQATRDLEFGLDAIFGSGGSARWFGPSSLVMAPPLASGLYVLRPLVGNKAEFEAILAENADPFEAEGFRIFVPRGAFPWKVVALTDTVVAFIPARELGSGLGPLTAGRDLPPSDLETQMLGLMRGEPSIFVALHAGGPLLHLDLPDRVGMTQLALRDWQAGGIDAQVVMQPLGDVDESASVLERREFTEETNQVQTLMSDVAFTPEADVVVGRLQIPADRVRHLQ